MKKLITYLLLISTALTVTASPVDSTRAVQVARNFVAQYVKGANQMEASVVYAHKMPKGDKAAIYAVNMGSAFVLVSADDVAHPVLGYSLSRPWPTRAALPSQVSAYLDDLAGQIEAASSHKTDRETAAEWHRLLTEHLTLTTNLPDSVGPLLTTTWDQGQYYNALCPEDANGPAGHVYTGCVATAMAQIINYWGYPVHGRGTHSYQHDTYGTLSVNYDSATYDYANMPNALTAASSPAQVNAVATLMRDCGVAANMNYGFSESSSYDVDARAGLINFFRLSPDLSYAEKTYFTNTEWENALRADIATNRPVMYSGHGNDSGHSFVCDGYKQNGYFHFNFGWSGYADGWYLTNAVSPAGMAFNSNQSALFGIVPDSTGNVILGQMVGNSTFTVDEPLEFYHLLGHNAYEGTLYSNECNNIVNFISANPANQLVADIIDFEDQNITLNDGNGAWLRSLSGAGGNNVSPVLSITDAMSITYSGIFYYVGFKISISQATGCRMVSNITPTIDATTVHLTWTENGGATQWQIEFGIKGFELGEGTVFDTTTNTITFENLEKFTEYDFYIRSVCDNNQYGPWNKVTVMVEAPYWQDIVTSQPEGYYYNGTTNTIEVTTPEALAWWAQNPNNTSVKILADIDLGEFKWRPIPMPAGGIEIDGEGHVLQNLFIAEPSAAAFIQHAHDCTIKNLVFRNAKVYGSLRTAVLFSHSTNSIVVNVGMDMCFVKGNSIVGLFAGETNSGLYKNCYTKGVVAKAYMTCGLFVGTGDSDFLNCYADGRAMMHIYSGIIAYKNGGNVRRCYSVDLQYGVVGSNHGGICIDTSSFWRNDNNLTLRSPISFDGATCNILIEALNNEVMALGDCELNTWITEDASSLPVFGPKYQSSCQNVSGLTAQNVIDNNELKVLVNWNDNQVSSWQIKVIENGLSDSNICHSNVVQSPTDTISGLTIGKKYEIYVRSMCSENTSGWGNPFVLHFDKPYWTEVINDIPDGFNEDDNGNVTISTAEGLAWLAKTSGNCFGKNIVLANDIDLSQYRWEPITFAGSFDGGNHKISNIYVNEPDNFMGGGFIGTANNAIIKNIQMDGGTVTGRFAIGGLVGHAQNNSTIDNCHSSVNVFSSQESAGSLLGSVSSSNVVNCSSSGNVHGNEAMGGLIGSIDGGAVINCHSSSNIYINHSSSTNCWYNGGLIGHLSSSTINNCYTIGTIETGATSFFVGKIIGCPEYNPQIQYVYAQDNVNPELGLTGYGNEETFNIAQFHHNNDSSTLLTPMTIGNVIYSDLLEALNAWVTLQNDHNLKIWILDSNTGYPVFGDYYEPSCFNPEDLFVSNATIIGDTTIRTKLTWTQNGEPNLWEVLYVASEHSIDSGIIVSVNSNPCVLTGIPVGQPLDFYVRAKCDTCDVSGWSSPVSYIPDKLRWTEVVTSQPEGYTEDADGNVYISSTEGLAWLSSVVNGLNGVGQQSFWGDKKIYVLTDIDLSLYRWTPIGTSWDKALDGCEIVGNNHIINGLYCNELADNMGLFGVFRNGIIHNLKIAQCSIWGEEYSGALAAQTSWTDIFNCIVVGNIYGIQNVGGIVGSHYENSIKNTCFVGSVTSRKDITIDNYSGVVGGISGVVADDTIINCYIVCEVPDDNGYSGIITGTGGFPNVVANYYYKEYETSLPITSNNCNTDYNSSFSGSIAGWTLNTPPFVNGSFRTDLIDALNAWVDANNADDQYGHWVADSTGENGGYPVLAYVPCSQGISDVQTIEAKIHQHDGKIVVEGAEGYPVTLYDAIGRRMDAKKEDGTVELTVPASGVYLVKIGDLPAYRVVVIR